MNAFQKTALTTVIATVVLISIGGLVRVTGAGLGCPDWPKCWGCWLPPSSIDEVDRAYVEAKGYDIRDFNPVKMWTEYLNRLIGVLIGFLVLATFVRSLPYRKTDPRIFRCALLSVFLVGFQGWLGGQVVRSELHPFLITLHMLLAIVLVSVLIYAAFQAMKTRTGVSPPPAMRAAMYRLSVVLFVFTGIQILIGTRVREGIDPLIKEAGGLPRSEWLAQVGMIDYVHRSSSWLVLIAGVLLYRRVARLGLSGPLRRLSRLLLGGIVFQIVLGVVLAYAGLPPPAQVLHLTTASALVCLEFYTILIVRAEYVSA